MSEIKPTQQLNLVEGSTKRGIVFPILDANTGQPKDLTGLVTSTLLRVFTKDWKTKVWEKTTTIPTPANGEILYNPNPTDYDNVGSWYTELEIFWADGTYERIHDLELVIEKKSPQS